MPTGLALLAFVSFAGCMLGLFLSASDEKDLVNFKEVTFGMGHVAAEGVLDLSASSPVRVAGAGQTTHLKFLVLTSGDVLLHARPSLFRLGVPQLCRVVLKPHDGRFKYTIRVPLSYFILCVSMAVFAVVVGVGEFLHGHRVLVLLVGAFVVPSVVAFAGSALYSADVRRMRTLLSELEAAQSVA